jgi:hypothetical protein
MPSNDRQPGDQAQYAAAVDRFLSEGGQQAVRAEAFPAGLTDAERTLMSDWEIHFDGRAFCFAGFRYTLLADALDDARRASPDGPRAPSLPWHRE